MKLRTLYCFGFLGAPVIGVVVDVAVFLLFYFVLGGNHHIARTAVQEAAIRAGVILDIKPPTSLAEDFLHLVKKFFGDNRLVLALIQLSRIAEQAAVKGVGEDKRHARYMDALVAFGYDAVLRKKVRNDPDPIF